MNCKSCKEEIPMEKVQWGGFHMACAQEEITVLKLGPEGCQKFCCEPHELIDFLPDDEKWEIEKRVMTRIEYEVLPEHTGF